MHEILFGSVRWHDNHRTGAHHPEQAARLGAVDLGMQRYLSNDHVTPIVGRLAELDELARVHHRPYLEALAQFTAAGGGDLDPDTHASAGSWETARWAAGLGLTAIDALDGGSAHAAFLALRPPGHHATS